MSSQKYIKLISEQINKERITKDKYIFQRGKTSVHRAKVVETFFKKYIS